MTAIRIPGPGDEEALVRFLEQHADTTMFLRSNLRTAGIEDRGEPYQGTYAAVFEGDAVVAVAAHYWNGIVVLEAPTALAAVVTAALRASPRRVRGLVGDRAQVVAARRLLRLDDAPATLDSREDLLALDLAALRVPAALTAGDVTCRPARKADADVLVPWSRAYSVETLGETDGPALASACRARVQRGVANGHVWVLEADGRPVAMSGFNATLPDCVQVGGVYTPPDLRSRGYARAAVAGSLLDARAAGAARSILFTGKENAAARACYLGLGYEIVGDYGLVLFADEHRPPV